MPLTIKAPPISNSYFHTSEMYTILITETNRKKPEYPSAAQGVSSQPTYIAEVWEKEKNHQELHQEKKTNTETS